MEKTSHYYGENLTFFGRPNVGKSAIANRLLGKPFLSVSAKAHTTRQAQGVFLNLGGVTHILWDVPGLPSMRSHRHDRSGAEFLKRSAVSALEGSQWVFFVTEGTLWTEEDKKALEGLKTCLSQMEVPPPRLVWVLNKIDRLAAKEALLPFIDLHFKRYFEGFFAVVPISAKQGDGIDRLKALLGEGNPLEPNCQENPLGTTAAASGENLTKHQIIQEAVREQIYKYCHKEIPYLTKIVLEWPSMQKLETSEIAYLRLHAAKPSHRQYLIGHQGSRIKLIREGAEKKLALIFQKKFQLILKVK